MTSAFAAAMQEIGIEPCDILPTGGSNTQQSLESSDTENERGPSGSQYSGRLEAIKLSGDVHVPRAEYTFIAPEIGDAGVMRIENEEPFKGARVVRAAGHIADRGFQNGEQTPSSMIWLLLTFQSQIHTCPHS